MHATVAESDRDSVRNLMALTAVIFGQSPHSGVLPVDPFYTTSGPESSPLRWLFSEPSPITGPEVRESGHLLFQSRPW